MITNKTPEIVQMVSYDELVRKKAGPIEGLTPFHDTLPSSLSLLSLLPIAPVKKPPSSGYKNANNHRHWSPPTLCQTLFMKAIIGGAVTNAAMRTARTGTDAAIVIAATDLAATADGFQDSSAGAVTDASVYIAKPERGALASATDSANTVK